MIFKNCRKVVPYAQIEHSILEDANLSWKAKGLLCYLISRPMDWTVRMADLEKRSTDGLDSVRTAVHELERVGYISRVRVRDSRGRLTGWEFSVFEAPQPKLDFPILENPTLSKKDSVIKNRLSPKETPKGETFAVAMTPVGGIEEAEPATESPALFKNDTRSKAKKLAALPTPSNCLKEVHFNQMIERLNLTYIADYRPHLYDELCAHKWHAWNKKYKRWVPIRNPEAFVIATEEAIANRFDAF